MLTAERRQYILNMLHRDGKIVARRLSEELGLSEDTIRRDLRDLAEDGKLVRVHGGALPSSPATANFTARQEQAPQAKEAIAQAAAAMVRAGQVIFLDGGTTNLLVAQHLMPDLQVTVITNSPPVAVALAEHPRADVLLLGGQLLKHSIVTVGTATLEAISMVRADLYFLGICSLHPDMGISTNHLEEAYLKRAMVERSAEVIALVSPEKLNTASSYRIGPLTELSEIITEREVAEELLAPYRNLGITVTRV
ncbi:DeoR/GlpR transcriptional regulator [Ktedonosporobacter rubrisoli]|uniref:Lactose phosphotransferase system repressor n=1 Tax=Ktedonosporobacter rubrisoli TaxID=2509675 RepID=A0A4P6JKN0_KTERU|nr:DeoR/GlpR family DNA-binding transcription regulator [Ktedonosporobacter rubrisoli]QBD75522.1 DeoR/GlpR transcriptional regulator [Ktedonosporobacter rubrisoli]